MPASSNSIATPNTISVMPSEQLRRRVANQSQAPRIEASTQAVQREQEVVD